MNATVTRSDVGPNDASADFERRVLPDHGEWWTKSWTIAKVSEGIDGSI